MAYDAATYMDEKLVPENGRVLFVRAKDYPKIILSDEWKGLDNLAGKQLPTGTVGQIAGFTVVKVPSNMFPADVYMIAMQESAAAFPYRINDTKVHQDPPGISGALIEGRQTYDLFVLASKADAVVIIGKTASKQACTVAIASHSATVTAAGADEIWYIAGRLGPALLGKPQDGCHRRHGCHQGGRDHQGRCVRQGRQADLGYC